MDHLKTWLDRDEPPSNYYQLLGEPCLSAQRERLLKAVRTATKFLHLRQNHKQSHVVQRARRLQLLCGMAEHTFSDAKEWARYDGQLLNDLRDQFGEQTATAELRQSLGDVQKWLQEVHGVAAERLDEVAHFVTQSESASHGADSTAPETSTTHVMSRAAGAGRVVETHDLRPDAAAPVERLGTEPRPAVVPRNLPFTMGVYEVLERLGEGGIGIVYKARHLGLQKFVAVKLLRSDRPNDANSIARFEREMRAIGQLDHPNIVRATDAGQFHDSPFLVMDLIEGRNLHDVVQSRGPLPVAEACDVIRQAALGLAHAHERGLVHRDIKPANLMMARDGTVKILDLGLALFAPSLVAWENADANGPRSELTAVGVIVGTIDYMAPEQLNGRQHVDARTDIYSLGCTLFFLLTGQAAFRECGSDLFLRMAAHATHPVPRLSQFRSDVPPALDEVLQRMMAKSPQDRFQSAGAVATALETVLHPTVSIGGGAASETPTVGFALAPTDFPAPRPTPPVPPRHRAAPPPTPATVTGKPSSGGALEKPALPRTSRPPSLPSPKQPPSTQKSVPTMRATAPTPVGAGRLSGSGPPMAMMKSGGANPLVVPALPRHPSSSANVIVWCAVGTLLVLTLVGAVWLVAMSLMRDSNKAEPRKTTVKKMTDVHRFASGHVAFFDRRLSLTRTSDVG